jgi:hypothetical protein
MDSYRILLRGDNAFERKPDVRASSIGATSGARSRAFADEPCIGLVGEDNTFRGPKPSSYVMSAREEGQGVVVLRIQRRDLPRRREIRIARNDSWKESTNGGPVERSSADFWSEQTAIIRRLFDDIRGGE